MEPSKKNPIRYMIIFGAICIFILCSFIGGYAIIMKSYYNSYEDILIVNIKAINKANKSTAGFMKEGNIDVQKAKTNLPTLINTLQKSKDEILALNPTDKYIFSHTNLIQGLTNNINIYAQILNVLNNPEALDISSSRTSIKNFEKSCVDNYSQISIEKLKISLQPNTLSFIDSSIYYIDQLIKIKNNQGVSDSQTSDFISGIDECFKNFQKIKTDFKAYLFSLRNNNSSYDDLINLMGKNKSDLSNLKIDFAKISVPEKLPNSDPIVIFDALKNTMSDYGLYLDSFTYALANEKVQASLGNMDKNIADKFYTESDLKISTVTKDYNNFIVLYNGFKDIK